MPANARAVHQVIRAGLVKTCHDCSEGGLAVALAEMSVGGRVGCQVDLGRIPTGEGELSLRIGVFGDECSIHHGSIAAKSG